MKWWFQKGASVIFLLPLILNKLCIKLVLISIRDPMCGCVKYFWVKLTTVTLSPTRQQDWLYLPWPFGWQWTDIGCTPFLVCRGRMTSLPEPGLPSSQALPISVPPSLASTLHEKRNVHSCWW